MFPHLPLVQLAHKLPLSKEGLRLDQQQEQELERRQRLKLKQELWLQVGAVGHDFVREL